MGEYNRVQLPIYSLGSPANHFRQHEVNDEVRGLESTERPNSNGNSFDKNSMIRVKELRADKNSGVVKTTRLLVSNANFFQPINGGPDAYGVDLKALDFDKNSAAVTVRSGGAFIGGGCRISGQLSSSIAYNDVPDSLEQNVENPQRIRFYTPVAQQPFLHFYVASSVSLENSELVSITGTDRVRMNIPLPTAMLSMCRANNNQPGHNYLFFVQASNHFGRGYCVYNNLTFTYDLFVTEVGVYNTMIIGLRTDIAAVSALRGVNIADIFTTGFYQEPDVIDDPTP